MPKIVLTTDESLSSEYHGKEFIGFAACGPTAIPDFLFRMLFCPPVKYEKDGEFRRAKFANCGVRKIEASLLENGFSKKEVLVSRPQDLKYNITKETKVVCITANDPLGLGPASTTFSDLIGKETFSAKSFRKLLSFLNSLKTRHNFKIIVGGPGAWQLEDKRILELYKIDAICIGEGEITAVKLINKILNGEEISPINYGEIVPLDKIPVIRGATVNGLVEICRGCGRGCKFCNPTMLNYRCQPIEKILKEVELNQEEGTRCILHAEDVLRYGAKKIEPDKEKVMKLFKSVVKKLKNPNRLGISHFAFASALAEPSLIKELSELMNAGSEEYPWISGQVGLETGSIKLIRKYMVGKAKPFKPEEWPEVVKKSMALLTENNWVPCATIILGLEGEELEDTRATYELIQDLKEYKSFIVPLFFVPIGVLKEQEFFKTSKFTSEQWKLLALCWRHNFYWIKELERDYIGKMNLIKRKVIEIMTKYALKKVEPYLKLMEEGLSPIEYEKENK